MDGDEFVEDFPMNDGVEEDSEDNDFSAEEEGFLQGYNEADEIEKTVDFDADEI